MKAKRLTALALAALMAASTMSVALAGEKVSNDLDFAKDGKYYKYDPDDNRLEAVAKDSFQPGDDVYILLKDGAESFTSKKTYNAYGTRAIGESWVEDIDVVYRKGLIESGSPLSYSYKVNANGLFAGWADKAYTSTEADAAKRLTGVKNQLLADSDSVAAAVNVLVNGNYKKASGYIYNGKVYPTQNDALVNGAHVTKKSVSDNSGDYTEVKSGYVVDGMYYASINEVIPGVLKGATITEAKPEKIYVKESDTAFGIYKVGKTDDEVNYVKEVTNFDNMKLFSFNGTKYWLDTSEGNRLANLNSMLSALAAGKNASEVTSGYKNNSTGEYVSTIPTTQNMVEKWIGSDGTVYDTKDDAVRALGIVEATANDMIPMSAGTDANGVAISSLSTLKAGYEDQIRSAINGWTDFSAMTETKTGGYTSSTQYEYWVKISTKDSVTTKDIDVVGTISVGTSKSSAEKDEKLSIDFTLTNANTENGGYFDDVDSDITIEDGERAVVSFSDDAEDLIIEFGDDAWFEFNARGQGKLNLAYNTKYNKDFAYDYDDANIDFITFEGEPTTNRTGTLYIYADEDSYIYEVTSKGAKKINGAYYDDDEEAWVIRTRNLTSYAISDKKLKTVDQMNNGSSSSSGSKPGSNSGSGSNNGKPNPDTGR